MAAPLSCVDLTATARKSFAGHLSSMGAKPGRNGRSGALQRSGIRDRVRPRRANATLEADRQRTDCPSNAASTHAATVRWVIRVRVCASNRGSG